MGGIYFGVFVDILQGAGRIVMTPVVGMQGHHAKFFEVFGLSPVEADFIQLEPKGKAISQKFIVGNIL